jgi:hypothetical protein
MIKFRMVDCRPIRSDDTLSHFSTKLQFLSLIFARQFVSLFHMGPYLANSPEIGKHARFREHLAAVM